MPTVRIRERLRQPRVRLGEHGQGRTSLYGHTLTRARPCRTRSWSWPGASDRDLRIV